MKIWRHKKTGGLYVILDDEVYIEKDWVRGVHYKSLTEDYTCVRPYSEFFDGRFELLNSIEYTDRTVLLKHDSTF